MVYSCSVQDGALGEEEAAAHGSNRPGQPVVGRSAETAA